MDAYKATALAEGFEDGDESEIREAWQYLVNTGMVWVLQGRFGRTAINLMDRGFIEPSTDEARKNLAVAREMRRQYA